MKKNVSLLILVMVLVSEIAFAQIPGESENDWKKLSFEVELDKNNYQQLEPIAAKFRLSNNMEIPLKIDFPDFIKDTTLRVMFKGKVSDFAGLNPTISQGKPQAFPGYVSPTFEPGKVHEKEYLIGINSKEIFSKPGKYQIQFFLYGSKGLASNSIDIEIDEPTGINKEAFEFLNKFENSMSFYWAWKEKNGLYLLETFVSRYGQSIYGERAILYLGNV
jgi:hypothetical protein